MEYDAIPLWRNMQKKKKNARAPPPHLLFISDPPPPPSPNSWIRHCISTKIGWGGELSSPLSFHGRGTPAPPLPPPPPPPPPPLLTGLLSIGSLSYRTRSQKTTVSWFFFLCRITDGSREQKGSSFFPRLQSD